MKTHTFLAAIVLTSGLGVANLLAQQDQTPATPAKGQAKGKMGMMGQMADHMAEMKGGQREMAALADKLIQSFAAVQAEKDPALAAKKLAEHGELLKQLRAKIQSHSQMMEKMEKEEKEEATPAPAHQH